MDLLIRSAEVDGRLVDVRTHGQRIAEITPTRTLVDDASGDRVARDGRVIDADGAALLPGLVDHHIHLLATAAAASSVDVGGPDGLAALVAGVPAGDGWIRAVGAQREVGRRELDALVPDRPVRVQHRSGAVWTLNTLALERLGRVTTEEARTGRIWRDDVRLRSLSSADICEDLAALGRRLASRGVTTVVDAGPDTTPEAFGLLQEAVPLDVRSLGPADRSMPRKIVVPDHVPLSLDDLAATVAAAHDRGRPVAVHCVTQQALAVLVAVLRQVGSAPGDRVEHAAVCDDALAEQVADLGLTVVTQPSLLARNGDHYLAESEPADRPHLWRHAGLIRAGVRVALSSDAPYGDADPWRTIEAATTRRTPSGTVVGSDEVVTPDEALRTFLTDPLEPAGSPRAVTEGAVADLVLLDRPLRSALATPAEVVVSLTVRSGALVHDAPSNNPDGMSPAPGP